MLTCLALVTETLLYCRPSLALFAVAHDLNFDVPGPSNRDAIVLSPITGTLCSGP